ncbi:MAG: hypothetical protein ACYC7A_20830 [Thermoanaerobaculia bacterium]
MRSLLAVLAVLAALALAAAAFAVGRASGKAAPRKAVTLKEEMILLDAAGHPAGRLPLGTVLYIEPDPLADRNTRLILHVMTDVNDEAPLQPMSTEKTFVYPLKSRAWLSSNVR